jgi:hypothetical protein
MVRGLRAGRLAAAWGARDPAITALCVMAFLSAGHVPGEGKYGGNIERGIKYVSDSQQQNGVFSGSSSA